MTNLKPYTVAVGGSISILSWSALTEQRANSAHLEGIIIRKIQP